MTFLGLPASTFALGLAGLAAALFALHLLRVRLRRQTVDSLLFFRQVGAVRKPRVLLGVPARWLSFALGLLLLAALWTAFARPRDDGDGPSRVLLVDATAAAAGPTREGARLGDALARRAAAIAATDGLGPRGRVLTFGSRESTLWRAGEPVDRIVERAATLPCAGSTADLWPALGVAARGLHSGDELVVLGGPAELPSTIDGIPVRRAEAAEVASGPFFADVREAIDGARVLDVEVATGGGAAVVRARRRDALLAEATVRASDGATARTRLGPLPDEALQLRLEVTADDGGSSALDVSLPARRPLRVHVAPDVPGALAIAADPRAVESDAAGADVLVVAAGSIIPDDRPALIVDPGAGAAPRAPRTTGDCPLPLGLRDRARREAPALAPRDGATVWVEDSASGAALVEVERDAGAPRVRTVAWLLDPPSHRDVPALLIGAIRYLGDGVPLVTVSPRAPAPAGAPTAPALDTRAGAFPLVALLLAASLLLLAADVWLHHRGRTA